MGFQQGLSGLNVSAKSLETIGNNIANASTVGFKSAITEFADIYANSFGGVATQAGLGAQVLSVRQQFSQGNISTSSNSLDLAINGQGFFRLSNNGTTTYSRNGEFSLDKDGFIVSSNKARLTGYPADQNGQIIASSPQDLQVQLGNIAPKSTSSGTVSLNLDSRETPPTTPFSLTDPTTYNNSTALTAYDVQGNAQTLTVYLRKTATNAWDVYGASNGTQIGTTPIGSVTFNVDGSLATGSPLTVTMTGQPGVQGALSFPLDLADTTQFGVDFAVNQTKQNGYTTGRLAGFSISADGSILGQYTNGQSRAQGQIALANFINPQGLVPQGNNQWAESGDSGQPTVSTAGSGSLGTLQSGALEESNVDLTAELVNMITAQRVYQANAQTIKTEDSILQTIVNLR